MSDQKFPSDRVLVMVQAATLPSQHDGTGPCIIIGTSGDNKLWLERLPDPYPIHEKAGIFPHPYLFPLAPQVLIGTPEEIMAAMREQLMACVDAMQHNVAMTHDDTEAALENAKTLGYEPGKALSRPLFNRYDLETLPYHRSALHNLENVKKNVDSKK